MDIYWNQVAIPFFLVVLGFGLYILFTMSGRIVGGREDARGVLAARGAAVAAAEGALELLGADMPLLPPQQPAPTAPPPPPQTPPQQQPAPPQQQPAPTSPPSRGGGARRNSFRGRR